MRYSLDVPRWFHSRVAALVAFASLFAPSLGAQQLSPRVEKLRTQAEQGDRSAQSILGLMYYLGQGVPQDYAEVVKWFLLAAEQGYASAQFNLGVMYHQGEGVPQDYAEALKWFRLAAEQGDGDAQVNLGRMYANGEGVPQDYLQAHKWFDLAASRASGQDAEKFGKARDRVAKKMSRAQIAEAQRLAREWTRADWWPRLRLPRY